MTRSSDGVSERPAGGAMVDQRRSVPRDGEERYVGEGVRVVRTC